MLVLRLPRQRVVSPQWAGLPASMNIIKCPRALPVTLESAELTTVTITTTNKQESAGQVQVLHWSKMPRHFQNQSRRNLRHSKYYLQGKISHRDVTKNMTTAEAAARSSRKLIPVAQPHPSFWRQTSNHMSYSFFKFYFIFCIFCLHAYIL